jgi:hypothetical protein
MFSRYGINQRTFFPRINLVNARVRLALERSNLTHPTNNHLKSNSVGYIIITYFSLMLMHFMTTKHPKSITACVQRDTIKHISIQVVEENVWMRFSRPCNDVVTMNGKVPLSVHAAARRPLNFQTITVGRFSQTLRF